MLSGLAAWRAGRGRPRPAKQSSSSGQRRSSCGRHGRRASSRAQRRWTASGGAGGGRPDSHKQTMVGLLEASQLPSAAVCCLMPANKNQNRMECTPCASGLRLCHWSVCEPWFDELNTLAQSVARSQWGCLSNGQAVGAGRLGSSQCKRVCASRALLMRQLWLAGRRGGGPHKGCRSSTGSSRSMKVREKCRREATIGACRRGWSKRGDLVGTV